MPICLFKEGFICLHVTGQEFQYCKNIIVFRCIHKFNGILVQNSMEFLKRNLRKIDLRKVNVSFSKNNLEKKC